MPIQLRRQSHQHIAQNRADTVGASKFVVSFLLGMHKERRVANSLQFQVKGITRWGHIERRAYDTGFISVSSQYTLRLPLVGC